MIERSDSTAVGTTPLPASANGSIVMFIANTAVSSARSETTKPITNRLWFGFGACSDAVSGTWRAPPGSGASRLRLSRFLTAPMMIGAGGACNRRRA